jgi:para-aminobenzoate synthetase component 1
MAYYILKSYKLGIGPDKIFSALKDSRNSFFLDSGMAHRNLGRYSFLGAEPFSWLKVKSGESFSRLREELEKYRLRLTGNCPPFLGGAVGYLAYDLSYVLEEKLKARPKAPSGIPDCLFGFYNTVVIIDHLQKRLYICAVGFPEKKYHLAKLLAESNFKKMQRLLSEVKPRKDTAGKDRNLLPTEVKSNFKKDDYLSAIKKAKEYIRAGDIYQVNLSQQFLAKTDLPAPLVYERLRSLSPSCFGAYFDAGDHQVLSSSPERFLFTKDRVVTTRPMKGTRGRSPDNKKDRFLKAELLKSAKDKAELVMIVDLERNDLGRVCSYNSIRVPKLRELEKYNTVYQTTATVEGKMYKDKDRFDLLRACFPGGSVTGCPKIRAMQIIEELEPHRRSIYTGSLGYLSFSGNMGFNILIRTILKKGNELSFGVGGGIVADSDPEDEYQETLVKAKAMIDAIKGRQR